jgi:hypothetical protein
VHLELDLRDLLVELGVERALNAGQRLGAREHEAGGGLQELAEPVALDALVPAEEHPERDEPLEAVEPAGEQTWLRHRGCGCEVLLCASDLQLPTREGRDR